MIGAICLPSVGKYTPDRASIVAEITMGGVVMKVERTEAHFCLNYAAELERD
jgi:hypothetical protein